MRTWPLYAVFGFIALPDRELFIVERDMADLRPRDMIDLQSLI